MNSSMPSWYPDFRDAVAAHLTATDQEPLLIYWSIGQEIIRRQPTPEWSSRIVDHLSADLKSRFPNRRGLSARNLRYMLAFAKAWPHEAYARGPLTDLPWNHHITLLQKLDNLHLRLWYAQRAVDESWTGNTLKANITSNLHRRK